MVHKKTNTYDLAVIRLLATPYGELRGSQDVKNTGYWPQIAEMHMKGMISVIPDSCILPYIEKH